jgi:hypothetical protein
MTLADLAANTRAAAAHLDHEWDERAIDWPLTAESVVVEVGGYTGRWALQIAERYGCLIEVYEPQPWAAAVCVEVLKPYAASVLPWGLGVRNEELPMGEWETDGCSFIKPANGPLCQLVDAATVLPGCIDLMLMNIEGYEYTLIPYLLDNGILPQRLMVQFHPFTDDQKAIQTQIYDRLAALGYAIAWSYDVILTAWERAA